MIKVLVIVGPTGTHKSDLAKMLAKKFNGAIINADAFQVYQEIKIGTGQTPPADGINFYLNGTVSIFEEWNIKRFQQTCTQIIKEIVKQKQLPIIIGGSNLYIDALIYNYDLSATKRDDKYDNLTIPELFSLLSSKDEQLANKIGNNKVRLVRALQILDQDKSLVKKNQPIYDYKIITCNYHTRKVLMDVVNNNVDKMLKNGWIDEVKNLLKAHGSEKLLRTNAFKALGYKDIVTSITSNTKLDIDKIKTNSRHYAKRQITWIKHHYLNPLTFVQDNIDEIYNELQNWIN